MDGANGSHAGSGKYHSGSRCTSVYLWDKVQVCHRHPTEAFATESVEEHCISIYPISSKPCGLFYQGLETKINSLATLQGSLVKCKSNVYHTTCTIVNG